MLLVMRLGSWFLIMFNFFLLSRLSLLFILGRFSSLLLWRLGHFRLFGWLRVVFFVSL